MQVHLSENDDEDVRIITGKEYGDLYRRYGGEKQKGVGAPWRPSKLSLKFSEAINYV